MTAALAAWLLSPLVVALYPVLGVTCAVAWVQERRDR